MGSEDSGTIISRRPSLVWRSASSARDRPESCEEGGSSSRLPRPCSQSEPRVAAAQTNHSPSRTLLQIEQIVRAIIVGLRLEVLAAVVYGHHDPHGVGPD